jgi:hypothetical protein
MSKLCYVAHPATTHGDLAENMAKQPAICATYDLSNEIPISPLLCFGGWVDPAIENHHKAMAACFALLKQCDEIHMWGQWWLSKGCKQEVEFAKRHNIAIVYKTQPYGDVVV